MVAFGRALMLEPQLLLLDEPTAGLSPRYCEQIFQIIRDVRAAGVAVLLVEQRAKQALAFCDRAYVLASGRNRAEGTGQGLLADRSEEHTSELQSLMRISYAVFCLKNKKKHNTYKNNDN